MKHDVKDEERAEDIERELSVKKKVRKKWFDRTAVHVPIMSQVHWSIAISPILYS